MKKTEREKAQPEKRKYREEDMNIQEDEESDGEESNTGQIIRNRTEEDNII